MMYRQFAGLALFASLSLVALPLSGCNKPAEETAPEGIKVQSASVRVNPNAAAPSAAYFTIIGGIEADTLTAITSPEARRVEMHESRMVDGLMTMAAVDHVDVPAGARVAFRQGGLHVMLFDIDAAVRGGGKLHLLLMFKNGSAVPVEITVPAPPPPIPGPLVRPNDPRLQEAPLAPPAHIAPVPRPPVIAAPAPTDSGEPAPASIETDHDKMGHHEH